MVTYLLQADTSCARFGLVALSILVSFFLLVIITQLFIRHFEMRHNIFWGQFKKGKLVCIQIGDHLNDLPHD